MLGSRALPGAEWFPGALLNYAEHAVGAGDDLNRVAVHGRSQTRPPLDLTFGALRDQVAQARAGLARLGVGEGDRVVAYLPNVPETVVAFLATAGLGAVWASCAPEFGVRAVADRFTQVEPKVLLTVSACHALILATRPDLDQPNWGVDPSVEWSPASLPAAPAAHLFGLYRAAVWLLFWTRRA